jgi:hypothetical protein
MPYIDISFISPVILLKKAIYITSILSGFFLSPMPEIGSMWKQRYNYHFRVLKVLGFEIPLVLYILYFHKIVF